MILADSHAHLDFPDFADDLDAVVGRAREAGVQFINTIGTRLSQSGALCALAERFHGVQVTVGVHPHHVGEEQPQVADILAAVRHPRVVGVGETGLDYHYDHAPRGLQQAQFRTHIQAALAADLPLVVHTREAEEDTRRILEEEQGHRAGGVIHCFTGSRDLARWAVGRGYYLSFSGVLTFKTAQALRDIAAWVPLERVLVETDCPYLAPVPHRGRRNEPAHVREVAQMLAEVQGRSLEEVARITTANYHRLFRVESAPAGATLAYAIRDALYLNVTRGCTLRCGFCPKWIQPVVQDYDLTLERSPSARDLLAAMGDVRGYREVVFCGYGEPTLRWKVILEVAREVKRQGVRTRLNTDGLANLVYGRDVTPEMAGLIDALSVSLNAQDEVTYQRHCRPTLPGAYAAVKAFILAARAHVPEVTATAIQGLDGVDVDACRGIAQEELGVAFRERSLNRVG
ncbi:MAG: YchF/TatD family DNA exonuclease [Magnetococcus sp. WYHC-3]